MTATPSLIFVEHIVWDPGPEWQGVVAELATRFARSGAPLDPDAVTRVGPLHAQMAELNSWAESAGVDLSRELGRWLDEHLSMHVRPVPSVTRAVRALAAERPVHIASALPARAAEAITRHAGCWRSVSELHDGVLDADGLAHLMARLTPGILVAAPPTPLPPHAAAISLARAAAANAG